MSLNFSLSVQIMGSEFDMNNMKAWIHPAVFQQFGLVVPLRFDGYFLKTL